MSVHEIITDRVVARIEEAIKTGKRFRWCKPFTGGVKQAISYMSGLPYRGVNRLLLDNNSMSTLMRNILLSFAQFERDMIVKRTQEGKAIAKQRDDFREGRSKKFSNAQINHALSLLNEYSYKQVEQMTGISKSTLIRCKKNSKYIPLVLVLPTALVPEISCIVPISDV